MESRFDPVAYLQLTDIDVPTFTIIDHIAYHPNVETWDYPKAGDPNPEVQLGVVMALGGDTTWINLAEYAASEPLVVSVGWSPDGQDVVFQVQDREQTWLDLNVARPGGETTRLLRETTETWVNVNGPPTWLKDDSYLWLSERSGWRHLYHLGRDGTVISQVTDGLWEVRNCTEWMREVGGCTSPGPSGAQLAATSTVSDSTGLD